MSNVLEEDSVTIYGTSAGEDTLRGGLDVVNFIYGNGGDDLVVGGNWDQNGIGDRLFGGEGNDRLQGNGGSDNINGNEGNSSGGTQTDIAVFRGSSAEYTFAPSYFLTSNTVRDTVDGRDATDSLFGIDAIEFLGDSAKLWLPVITAGDGGPNDVRHVTVASGTSTVATVAASDAEDGANLTYSIIDFSALPSGFAPPHDTTGLFAIAPDTGELTLTRTAAAGAYDVWVRTTDSDGLFDLQHVVVTLNTAPVAIDDMFSTNQNVPFVVHTNALLANDTDADGDALQVSGISNLDPRHLRPRRRFPGVHTRSWLLRRRLVRLHNFRWPRRHRRRPRHDQCQRAADRH